MRLVVVVALVASLVASCVHAACTSDTCEACLSPAGVTCQWCGDYSHGKCLDYSVPCMNTDQAVARNSGSCPPRTEHVLLPVLGAYLGVTLLIILQHLVEMRWDRVPANLANELDDFSHLSAADRRTVAAFARETIRYADYGRKVQRHVHFIWLLGLASGGVAYTVYYQERLGPSGWVVVATWISMLVLLLVLKALRKPALYVLTEDKAVIVTPKYLGVCGNSYRLVMPHRTTPEVYLAVRPDGVGSVYFAREQAYDDESDAAAGHDGEIPELVGFTGILRAGEVHELVASWRARRLSLPVPEQVNPPPKRRRSLIDRIQSWVLTALFSVFIALFAVLTMVSDQTGTRWLLLMTIPYGAIWASVGAVYLWRALARWRRRGFMQVGAQSGVVVGDWSDDDATAGAVGRVVERRPAAAVALRPMGGHAALTNASADSDIEVDLRAM